MPSGEVKTATLQRKEIHIVSYKSGECLQLHWSLMIIFFRRQQIWPKKIGSHK